MNRRKDDLKAEISYVSGSLEEWLQAHEILADLAVGWYLRGLRSESQSQQPYEIRRQIFFEGGFDNEGLAPPYGVPLLNFSTQ